MNEYKFTIITSIVLIILFISPVIIIDVIRYSNETIVEIEIKDKYVKGEQGTYFVIDKNDNAYIIEDLIFKGKFNSTDLYNKLEIGNKYKIKTTGRRIHFLSMYPNINKILEEN